MDRAAPSRTPGRIRFPHTRGDGPEGKKQGFDTLEFSPHAWGWTVLQRLLLPGGRVFPTRVGMDRRGYSSPTLPRRFPHTRGDGPFAEGASPDEPAFSPHAWGWTAGVLRGDLNQDVFPTRVGMDRPRYQAMHQTEAVFPTRVGMDRRRL